MKYSQYLVGLLSVVVCGLIVALRGELVEPHMGWPALAAAGAALWGLHYFSAKQFHEYEIVPVDHAPRTLQRFARRHQGWLEQLHFQLIGDFQLQPPPDARYSRAFISPGGRCFAYLCQAGSLQVYGFISVCADGTYLESSMLKLSKVPEEGAPLKFFMLPKASIVELFAFHRQQAEEFALQHETSLLVLQAERYAEVSTYGHRLSGWDRYQQGMTWSPPQAREQADDTHSEIEHATDADEQLVSMS